MKRMYIGLLVVAISGLLLSCSVGVKDNSTKVLDIGDYLYYGKYLDKPILWRIINLDKSGNPMLFSERILCIKPFNGANGGGEETYNFELLNKHIRVYWKDANLRQWLNSSDQVIKWEGVPPSLEYVSRNPYELEAGFLSDKNFTRNEREILLNHKHDVLLSEKDEKEKEGGSDSYYPIQSGRAANRLDDAEKDYSNIYYKTFTDKVFLLSTVEIKRYVWDRGWECRRKPTKEAVKVNTVRGFSDKDYCQFWLETPHCFGDSIWALSEEMRSLPKSPGLVTNCPTDGYTGVCPAVVLNKDLCKVKSGKGSENKPYEIVPISGE
ncbi:MAG TPA: DUF6273 domain-containing protein [Pseudobacteroides sp.]|uniref:DUF6273 domain-containing protein n=1 Tax=Pseudobacteroides sp. TaxID=1968840 RepID=UPI002F91EA35